MVSFTASAINTGATPVYNWSVNGVTVSPGASYSYIPLNGDIVQVSLASSENCATPAVVTAVKTMAVMPNELPAVNVAVSPAAEVCEGTTVTFTATPFNGGSSPVYAWMKNGVNVGYASTYSYLPASGDNVYCVMTSDYRCRVADDATSSNTRMTVVVPVIPTVTISADPGTNVSPGQLVYLTANVVNGGVAPVYQWLLNGAAIAGANTANYSTTSYSDNDQFSVNVTSNGVCTGNTGSGSVTIHVSNVGVKTIAAALSDIKIIPNPSNGLFAIKGSIGNGVDHISVEISDMMGRAVYSNITDVHNGMIDTTVKLNSDLSNGMYILSIKSENEASVYHLAIER